jgi:hypothetical protein
MPPFVGRVLEPSVAGMRVAGDLGLSETTMPGGENVSPVGDGSGEAWRSDAMFVASVWGGGMLERSSPDVLAWPLSVTAEWRE